MFEEIFKNLDTNGDTQNVDTTKTKLVFTLFPIKTKVTINGIKITLKDKTIIKDYNKNYKVMLTFTSRKDALKEFNRHRKSHKEL